MDSHSNKTSTHSNKKTGMKITSFLSVFCGEYRARTDDLLHAMQAL